MTEHDMLVHLWYEEQEGSSTTSTLFQTGENSFELQVDGLYDVAPRIKLDREKLRKLYDAIEAVLLPDRF
jgi:hypothetical protein